MQKVKWLVEDFCGGGSNSFDKLFDTVVAKGFEAKKLTLNKLYTSDDKFFPDEDCVLFHGSMGFAQELLAKRKWIPCVFFSNKEYTCDYYYSYLGKYLFNDYYTMLPMSEFIRRKDEMFDTFGREGNVFIRPSSGNKTFTGQLIANDELFDNEIKYLYQFAEPHTLIIVSTPKTIKTEYRTIVNGKNIIASSMYKKNGELVMEEGIPDNARTYLLDVLQNTSYNPHPLYSLDLAEDADGNFWVLEVGSFSCSGLYACNMNTIIDKASELAIQEWESYNTI